MAGDNSLEVGCPFSSPGAVRIMDFTSRARGKVWQEKVIPAEVGIADAKADYH